MLVNLEKKWYVYFESALVFIGLLYTPLAVSQNLIGDVESGGIFSHVPYDELFGTYDFDMQLESIGRDLFADPNSNFYDSYLVTDDGFGTYIRDEFSGDVYYYTIADFEAGNRPVLTDLSIGDIPSDAFSLPIFLCHCYFYNNLPNIQYYVDGGGEYATIVLNTQRETASSQAALNKVVSELKQSSFSNDPFVRLGLEEVLDIVLINNKRTNGNKKTSPSQYSDFENTIYINSNDLSEYGYVVVIHELLQAGLKNALTRSYITQTDFSSIAKLNRDHFSYLDGYVGVSFPSSVDKADELNYMKAFAIGYTYKLFKQYYNSLPGVEKNHAKLFFNDVEKNKRITKTTLGSSNSYSYYYLLGKPATTSNSDITKFISAFTNNNSAVGKKLKKVSDKILSHIKRDNYRRVLPAIKLLLGSS